METTSYTGIDYGMGRTNIHEKTGIRFGVIPSGEVGAAWYEDSEADYGDPTCGQCDGPVVEFDEDKHQEYEFATEHGCVDYACENCKTILDAEDVFPIEPMGFSYEDEGYALMQQADDPDLWVMESPYFTYAQFCSPCAPGAVYLTNPLDHESDINKGYCLGHDWFEGNVAPYPVYSVETGELIEPEGR